MKMSSIAILVMPSSCSPAPRSQSAWMQGGPGSPIRRAGFSEILYAFSSAATTTAARLPVSRPDTPFYNVALALTMWLGRFWPIVAVLPLQARWPPRSASR